jgi:hypothetical protein
MILLITIEEAVTLSPRRAVFSGISSRFGTLTTNSSEFRKIMKIYPFFLLVGKHIFGIMVILDNGQRLTINGQRSIRDHVGSLITR